MLARVSRNIKRFNNNNNNHLLYKISIYNESNDVISSATNMNNTDNYSAIQIILDRIQFSLFGTPFSPERVEPKAFQEIKINLSRDDFGFYQQFLPIEKYQNLLDIFYTELNIPYYYTIIAIPFIMKLILFPFQLRGIWKYNKYLPYVPNMMHEYNLIVKPLIKDDPSGATHEMNKLKDKYGFDHRRIKIYQNITGLFIIPIHLTSWVALRTMYPTFTDWKTGGPSFFNDLTMIDPSYMVPALCGISGMILFHPILRDSIKNNPVIDSTGKRTPIIPLILPGMITMYFSKSWEFGFALYFISNSMANFSSNMLFNNKYCQELFQIESDKIREVKQIIAKMQHAQATKQQKDITPPPITETSPNIIVSDINENEFQKINALNRMMIKPTKKDDKIKKFEYDDDDRVYTEDDRERFDENLSAMGYEELYSMQQELYDPEEQQQINTQYRQENITDIETDVLKKKYSDD